MRLSYVRLNFISRCISEGGHNYVVFSRYRIAVWYWKNNRVK